MAAPRLPIRIDAAISPRVTQPDKSIAAQGAPRNPCRAVSGSIQIAAAAIPPVTTKAMLSASERTTGWWPRQRVRVRSIAPA